MRVLLANKIGLALFVKGRELFAEYAQCVCMKILVLMKSFFM